MCCPSGPRGAEPGGAHRSPGAAFLRAVTHWGVINPSGVILRGAGWSSLGRPGGAEPSLACVRSGTRRGQPCGVVVQGVTPVLLAHVFPVGAAHRAPGLWHRVHGSRQSWQNRTEVSEQKSQNRSLRKEIAEQKSQDRSMSASYPGISRQTTDLLFYCQAGLYLLKLYLEDYLK